jgi:glycosyltransferase involved in cell wall biosynthesis/GT2 family glycosyltransferase
MARLTVVIPAYNAAATLGDTLDALAAQTMSPDKYSVIVVDDGSTDTTAALAAARGVAVLSQPNAGPAAARNAGAAAAPPDCEILVFTDADCAPAPDFLARLTAPLADVAVSGVQGAYRTRQQALTARFAQLEFEDRYAFVAKRPTIDLVATYAAAYRRHVFAAAGGFDVSFRVADNEDTELSYRLAGAGHRLVFAPDALVFHRHPASLARYLGIKTSRAYWRLQACRAHPEKILCDGYTPPLLRLQTLLAGIFALALLLAPLSRPAGLLALATLAGLVASSLPFVRFAARRDPAVAALAPGFITLRSLAFALGLARGLAERCAPAKPGRPGPVAGAPKRVGLDLHALSGIRQGSRTYIEALASRLPAAAPDLHFVYYASPDDFQAARALAGDAQNVSLRPIPAGRLARLVFPFPWRLAREVDVFHCQYLGPLVSTVPCVVSIHDILHESMPGYFPKGLSRLMRLLYPPGARRAAMVLTLSAFCREEIRTRYRVPADRLAYAFPGVDPGFAPVTDPAALAAMRARLGLPDGPYILSLGRLEPRKNIPGLAAAYGLLRQRLGNDAPHLVIAGPDDGLFADFGRRLRQQGAAAGVVFCGDVPPSELPALLSGAAVFAYPSFGEGFGLPVVEAMACGTPVVASQAPAVPEAAGGAALLVDPANHEALADALCRVLAEPGLAAELRAAGLARAARLDWNDTAAMAVAAYRRALAGHH